MSSQSSASTRRPARLASAVAATLFGVVVLFQSALAAGAPWGKAAWGGGDAELAVGQRVASGAAVLVLTLAAFVVLRRGGHAVPALLPDRWLPAAVWVLVGYSALGVLANGASRSGIERAIWTPVSLALAVSCLTVALAARRGD